MKLNQKSWIAIILIGLSGQLAWMVENMYLNVYVYHTISTDPNIIAMMVASSAIIATITTLLMGTKSDQRGKRKPYITVGYLLWGLSVIGFLLINKETLSHIIPESQVVLFAVIFIILWDCVMTFFGSTANDAAFNAWITDITTSDNRGKVESVLSIMPLIAMLVIFGLFDGLTQSGNWSLFFISIGSIVLVVGIISHFIIKDSNIKKSNSPFKEQVIYGFKKEVIQSNQNLYWSLLFLLIISISTQIWMPYLIIYVTQYLKITDYTLLLALVLIISSIISVLFGTVIDQKGKIPMIPYGIIILAIGLLGMFLTTDIKLVGLFATMMMSGNMILITIANGLTRDYTPENKAGSFQGIRMIFAVMLPMIIGPFIGSSVISNVNKTYIELGVTKQVPTPAIFLAALIVLILSLIVHFKLKRSHRIIK